MDFIREDISCIALRFSKQLAVGHHHCWLCDKFKWYFSYFLVRKVSGDSIISVHSSILKHWRLMIEHLRLRYLANISSYFFFLLGFFFRAAWSSRSLDVCHLAESLDMKLKLNGKRWLLEVGLVDEIKSGSTNNVLIIRQRK